MSRIKRIMVAVDFSVYSTDLTKYARGIAVDLNAKLVFVHVINRRDINALRQVTAYYSENLSVEDHIDKLKRDATVKMQKLIFETSCNNITHKIVIRKGVPFVELVDAAEEERVDIVIVGAKGRSNISGILSGSTAEKMFRRCPVPLLSIREIDNQKGSQAILRPLYISTFR